MIKIETPKPIVTTTTSTTTFQGHPTESYGLLSKVSGGLEIGEISLGSPKPCLLGANVSDHAHIMISGGASVSDHTHPIDLSYDHGFSRPYPIINPITNPQDLKHYHHLEWISLMPPVIINVIYNPPATIVFWEDGTKTVVKADGEDFDREKGLAMAFMKKVCDNKGHYFEQVKKWAWMNANE